MKAKAYRKGIKNADMILKKCPKHGETLAMKGLMLNCLNRKKEAYELVKAGVMANLKSHVCWHVYGLLYRSDQEYEEAIKCYKNALRLDKENLQVLRDLAQLQIQMRDLPGFLETRQVLLELKPTQGPHWVSLALAHHLNGNYNVAATVLDAYEGVSGAGADPYEHSEILLYKIRILEEGGDTSKALAALDEVESKGLVKDRLGAMETRARLMMSLNRKTEAEAIYRSLLRFNPENYNYHKGLLASLGYGTWEAKLKGDQNGFGNFGSSDPQESSWMSFSKSLSSTPEAYSGLIQLYSELNGEFPDSTAVRRIPLDFLRGEYFICAADEFIRPYLQRGVPSLFATLKPLYVNCEKSDALGALFHSFEESLLNTGTFPPLRDMPAEISGLLKHQEERNGDDTNGTNKKALVWALLCLAQHYDRLGDGSKSLQYIDMCLNIEPALVEALSMRSKILKHVGDTKAAAIEAQRARRHDMSDRYLNCMAVKALFRAGEIEEAERVSTLFTKDSSSGFGNLLYDMQATWYEIASGRSYFECGNSGMALKRFLQVDTHFNEFIEDQFDFHQYCVRKQTMRAYVDMLEMEDKLYRHPAFEKAAYGAVKIFLQLADSPSLTPEEEEEAAIAEMKPEEAKKYLAKRRKAAARRQKELEDAAAAAAAQVSKGRNAKKIDLDPNGQKLLQTKDPLGDALKLLQKLVAVAPEKVQGQVLMAEVQRKRGKLLLALAAIKQAIKYAGKDNPSVHDGIVRLFLSLHNLEKKSSVEKDAQQSDSQHLLILSILRKHMSDISDGLADAESVHQSWKKSNGNISILHKLTSAKLSTELLRSKSGEVSNIGVLGSIADEIVSADIEKPNDYKQHKLCIEVAKWLKDMNLKGQEEEWRQKCAKAFPYSRWFDGDSVVVVNNDDLKGDSSISNGENGVDKVTDSTAKLSLC